MMKMSQCSAEKEKEKKTNTVYLEVLKLRLAYRLKFDDLFDIKHTFIVFHYLKVHGVKIGM